MNQLFRFVYVPREVVAGFLNNNSLEQMSMWIMCLVLREFWIIFETGTAFFEESFTAFLSFVGHIVEHGGVAWPVPGMPA